MNINKEILDDLKVGLAILAFFILIGLSIIFLMWVAKWALA